MTYLECVDGKTWQLAPPTCFQIASFDKAVTASKKDSSDIHQNQTQHRQHPLPSSNRNDSTTLISNVLFSNTGWDLFVADDDGHVSILVTGIKKQIQHQQDVPQPPGLSNSAAPNTSQSPPLQQTLANSYSTTQYSRTSFNTAELLYSDNTTLPLPSLKTHTSRRLNKMVTVKWLNIDKQVIANSPAVKVQATSEQPVLNGCASKLGAAVQDSNGYYYSYNAQQYKSYGTMHPLSTKQACIGVRRSGEVCLWHQEDHGIEYRRVTAHLDLDQGDEILYASIGFKRDGKVIVGVSCPGSNSVKLFEIFIDWGYLLDAAKNLPKMPTYRTPDNMRFPPKLIVTKLFEIDVNDTDSSCSRLTSIDFISPNYHQSTEFDVLLTFENDGHYGSKAVDVENKSPSKSTILRYHLEDINQEDFVRSAFKTIANKRNIDSSSTSLSAMNKKTISKLVFKQKMTFNESIICIESLNLDMMICISFANGMMEVFNRSTMKQIKNIYSEPSSTNTDDSLLPSLIFSLFDAGFEFPRMNFQPEYTCISPNICCYIALPVDSSQLYIRSVESVTTKENTPPNKKGLLLATTAAIALRHTSACYFGYSTDDLMATIRSEIDSTEKRTNANQAYRLLISILQECQRAINLTIDISTEQTDKMLQNQPLQRILTLQLSLGTNLNWKRNKSGKIAWALVNLKFVTSSIMYTIHTIYSNMQRFAKKGLNTPDTLANARAREESIISVLGIIRWCMDYIIGLNQELLTLATVFKSGDTKKIEKCIADSIMVPLILGKVPRAFLIFAISNIRRLFSFVQKFVEKNDPWLTSLITPENQMGAFSYVEKQMLIVDSPISLPVMPTYKSGSASGSSLSNGMGSSSSTSSAALTRSLVAHPTMEAYYRLGAVLNNSPVSLNVFEKFLTEADVPLRNMRLDQSTSLAIEQQIVSQGYISKTFVEPLKKLCDVYEKSVLIAGNVDVTELYFRNVSWLKLGINGDDDFEEGDDDDDENNNNDFTDYSMFGKYNKKLIESNSYDGLLVDTLRKRLLKPIDFIERAEKSSNGNMNGSPATNIGNLSGEYSSINTLAMRRCIRCGAISSVNEVSTSVKDEDATLSAVTFVSNPVFTHYQRICFCGGAWANM
ncbi:hypothetical protein CANARDRAFT_194963 [[Candida] arabinofermentans NRRL YB-2248]|uniref:Mediator of RNA polymerase II transcription subunit 16 n=1 Tax=[Candida] arabinofermentans NRRL YB-2248 TaxID=983967 RepID=A0A1E4T762_9ASCO|nr:hypothetical protein CANARDRAFT_194963 [[Candida] arabinofermentans NRRL YB-2248]